ncbi:hypothetical protein ERJ75_000244200 [Trypanosoma vivax]|uniref:Uncharacterized protein n=1 Tax=Trypanosoma vivax (strain Y486) TaxID=1055687 RepID=G0U3V5_TRYVY|nr:hypothetical protein TRVL_05715 [Trypanosoma vivax]KAH8618691.1 hypothetical protein ERJ75_000244200 [Trypanosoma vivax]CCC50195.1 conserved hypothetical protein [Trypanosoma vivax Y486]
MAAHASDPAPCALEAALWRSCLKEFQYGPDRPKGACEKERVGYYSCIKEWSVLESPTQPYNSRKFNLVPECAREAEQLHHCMMTGMFEVGNCAEAMARLKRCGARHDTAIKHALEADPSAQLVENDPQGLQRLWYRAIGKL